MYNMIFGGEFMRVNVSPIIYRVSAHWELLENDYDRDILICSTVQLYREVNEAIPMGINDASMYTDVISNQILSAPSVGINLNILVRLKNIGLI